MFRKFYIPEGRPLYGMPSPIWLYSETHILSDGKEYDVSEYYLEDTEENQAKFRDVANKAFARRERFINNTPINQDEKEAFQRRRNEG